MIDGEITYEQGQGEAPKEPEAIMELVADIMYNSVIRNYVEGGRPDTWEPLKSGAPRHLFDSGRMWSAIHKGDVNETSAAVESGSVSEFPQLFVQEYGGDTHPVISARSKGFFWWMFGKTGDEMWKFMALKRIGETLNIHIPPSPAFLFQDEDIEQIERIIGENNLNQLSFSGSSV